MTTPIFVPQDQTSLKPIRFYTALDPYYFTVDNRPLKDLDDNIRSIGTGGSDAGRRASALLGLYAGSVNAGLFTPPVGSGLTLSMIGLEVSNPSSNVVRIAPGSIFENRLLNVATSQYVLKQALSLQNKDFNVPPPGVAGKSIVYAIEGQFMEITPDTISGSQLPYIDPLNPYLPSTLTNGELVLSINAGSAAPTGSQVPPATSPGKFQLYYVTLSDNGNVPSISLATNAPWRKGLDTRATFTALSANSATLAMDNESPSAVFADGAISGVHLTMQGNMMEIDPYRPIKLRVVLASSVDSGNVQFRLRYKAQKNGDLLNATYTTTNMDSVGIGGIANALQTYTTVNAVVPNTVFSSFSNGVWGLVAKNFSLILDRVGTDAGDTNTGTVTVIRVALFQ